MTQIVKLVDADSEGSLLASQMKSPLSLASTVLIVSVLLETGPLDVYVSQRVMEVRGLLTRAQVLLLAPHFIHIMLAGGLAVALHSMITVSRLSGELLLPRIIKLLKGTVIHYGCKRNA